MILHFYIARRFLANFFGVFILLGISTFLLEVVENLRRFAGKDIETGAIFRLTLLSIPTALHAILPMITAFATISLFISLSRSSELVVARASGRSAMRSLWSPVITALLLGVLAVGILNPIAAATSREKEAQFNRIKSGNDSALTVSEEGLWLRQGNAEGQTVIRAAHADLDGTVLSGVSFLALGPDGGPAYRVEAQNASLVRGAWELKQVKFWRLDGPSNPEREAEYFDEYRLDSDLTPDQIRDSFGTPSAISFWDLPGFIKRLESAGFSALAHQAWFQSQLALPFTMVAMVMVAAAFTLRHTRMGRTGVMIFLATICGFALSFVGNFATIMAENGKIPAALSAWGPPSAAILLSLGLLLHLEDG